MKIDIPDDDSAEFSNLKDETRSEVREMLRAIGRLMDVKKGICAAIKAEARDLGISVKTMHRKFDEWRNGCERTLNGTKRRFQAGDWRMLINFAKQHPVAQTLPAAFVEKIWKPLVEENQRKTKPAWRMLVRGFHRRRFIVDREVFDVCPGYENCPQGWPPANGKGIPHGWSYSNLLNYQPTDAEKCAMREGLGVAIARHVPKILHTRFGLYVGSHYSFDDVLRDMKALLIARNQEVRVQEIGCMDFFSADRFAVHRRPQYKDGDRTDNVKEREMRFLLAAVLRNNGYSPRGTEMIVERGTATIREPLEEFLYRHSDKKITVRRAGITGREQALKGYFGRGGGNPMHKALHEAHHNLLQNEAGHLPAPTGHDRNPPEWLFGIEAVTEDVCKSIGKLLADPDPLKRERAGLIFAPMCEYWQLIELLQTIDDLIAWRTDHRIEGWHKCGHVCVEYRRDLNSNQWLSNREFLALPSNEQQLIVAAATADPRYRNPRQLAPREVLIRGSADLIRFPDHVIALMFADDSLGEDLRETKTLTSDGQFDIANQLAGPERMRFAGAVLTPQGEMLRLVEHERYGVVLNPWDSAQLWIYDKDGGFLGTSPRVKRLSLMDDHTRALGEREHTVKTLLEPLRARHPNAAKEFAQMQVHNEKIADADLVTPREKLQREREKLRTKPATEFLTDGKTTGEGESPKTEIRKATDFL